MLASNANVRASSPRKPDFMRWNEENKTNERLFKTSTIEGAHWGGWEGKKGTHKIFERAHTHMLQMLWLCGWIKKGLQYTRMCVVMCSHRRHRS